MSLIKPLFPVLVAMLLILTSPGAPTSAQAQMRAPEDDSTRIHRLHVLMNHGLIMFLDGHNLKMVAGMRMSSKADPRTEQYARASMSKGKAAIEMALRGDQMQILEEQGFGDHPLMKTAVELGETMLHLVDLLENIDLEPVSQDQMDLHHMHLLINMGLVNVAQGSNMMMATLLASIPQIDQYLANHGRNMVKDGRALIVETARSSRYQKLLKSSGSEEFISQRKLCTDLSLKVVDILSRMDTTADR